MNADGKHILFDFKGLNYNNGKLAKSHYEVYQTREREGSITQSAHWSDILDA
jgi:hypothetical protein